MYISNYEAALALVATSMKKARLRIPTLIVNSLMGGIFFTVGGMFHLMLMAQLPMIYQNNPGIVQLMEGCGYPIGLFFVIIMGTELFNSNILIFTVGFVRRAVSIIDVLVSWFVSFWFNLVATIFVSYIICDYSKVFTTPEMIESSKEILASKASFEFHQTLIKAMTGNFFVSLGLYLQMMAKPLHVKFILIFLPVFTFVSLGFTHSVADMFVVVMGLINGSSVTVATVAWKILLPGAIGNIIGGVFFGIAVPWYSHIYLIEHDEKSLNLPRYDMRDEQPQINMDSRVVRQRDAPEEEEELEERDEEILDDIDKDLKKTANGEKTMERTTEPEKPESTNSSESNSLAAYEPIVPTALYSRRSIGSDSRLSSVSTGASIRSGKSLTKTRSRARSLGRSPRNVFPVYGMGEPLEREKTIATGFYDAPDIDDVVEEDDHEENQDTGAQFMGTRIKRLFSRRPLNLSGNNTTAVNKNSNDDLEQQRGTRDATYFDRPDNRNRALTDPNNNPNPLSPVESLAMPSPVRQASWGSHRSAKSVKNSYNNRKATAGIPAGVSKNNDTPDNNHALDGSARTSANFASTTSLPSENVSPRNVSPPNSISDSKRSTQNDNAST